MADDTQLELKKRARRRLVGAVALAVLAAIVLPMVMDQEPKSANQDVQIRIPSPDAGAFTPRILTTKPGSGVTPLPPATEGKSAEKPAEPAKPEASKAEPPRTEAPNPEAAPSAPAKADKQPEKAATKSADKPDDKQPADKAKTTGELARAEAILNGTRAEQWVVQLGAFQNPGNVRQLQAKLKSEGYNSYTEPLEAPGGAKTRVRAGPFSSREAAEKARDKLKRIGLNGVVAQKQ